MLPRLWVDTGAVQKFPESKDCEPEPEPPELDHFPGIGAGAGIVRALNSEPEPEPGPECFPGAGTGVIQNHPGSTSLLLTIQCHSCYLESSWSLGALLSARPPDLANRCALGLLVQAWGTHRDDWGIAQWIPSGGEPGMSCPLNLRRLCNHLTNKNCRGLKCPRSQGGDVHTARRVSNIHESI